MVVEVVHNVQLSVFTNGNYMHPSTARGFRDISTTRITLDSLGHSRESEAYNIQIVCAGGGLSSS